MEKTLFILEDIKEYIIFISQVKNLSENTAKSYNRDLKKLYIFLKNFNIFLIIIIKTKSNKNV